MAEAIIRSHPLQSWSYTAVEAIAIPTNGAGLLVEARAPGGNPGVRFAGVAAATSLRVVGVARHDVPVARVSVGAPQVGEEHRLTVVSGVIALVTFVAAAAEGDLLIAAAGGQVTPIPAVTTPTAADVTNTRAIIGRAMAAVGAGAAGLAWIKVLGV